MSVKAGSSYARALVKEAFDEVRDTGDAAPWIAAVVAARDAGTLPRDIAWFFIYKFGECAMIRVVETDPALKALSARIEAIERAGGLGEDDHWHLWEGPPEWLEANREWDALVAARLAELLRDAGEPELTGAIITGDHDEATFESGRRKLFGERDSALGEQLDAEYEREEER